MVKEPARRVGEHRPSADTHGIMQDKAYYRSKAEPVAGTEA